MQYKIFRPAAVQCLLYQPSTEEEANRTVTANLPKNNKVLFFLLSFFSYKINIFLEEVN